MHILKFLKTNEQERIKMGKTYLFFFIIFLPLNLAAQIIISGTTKSKQTLLPNVSVVVYQGDHILGYAYSNEEGFYKIQIKNLQVNKVEVSANILGYKEEISDIEINNRNAVTVDFFLDEKHEQLNEVVLDAWEKINVKKDTITFKVSAFSDGSERVVEDLLKNIPGVELSADGNIKVNGKSIDKLLIEGDDLFDDKYKLLSKNLDANVIKEIQVLNNYEDNPVLKNFQDSEKVAINLRLKDDKKNVWFGNIDIGYGTHDHNNSSANLGLLKKKIKLFNLTSFNDVGILAVSQVKNTSTIDITNVADKKIEKHVYDFVDIDNMPASNFSNNEDVFNKSFLNSLSFVTNLSNRIKLRNLTYYTLDDIRKENFNSVEYYIEPENIRFDESNKLIIKEVALATEFELSYLSDNKTYFTYNGTFEMNPTTKRRDLFVDGDFINQLQKDEKLNFFNHLNATKQLSVNSLFQLYAYFGVNASEQKYTINPNIFNELFENNEALEIEQKLNLPLNYFGLSSEILSKKGKSEYKITALVKRDVDEIKSAFNFENQPVIDSLSNTTSFKRTELSLVTSYQYALSSRFKIRSSIGFSQIYTGLNNTDQSLFFINPNLRLNYKLKDFGNFGLTYGFKNNLPRIQYLNSNYILKNYRTFTKGTDKFEAVGNHNVGFYYTYSDFKKQFLVNAFLMHNSFNKSYGTQSFINQNINQNQYVITDGGSLTNFSLSGSKYISAFSSAVKLGMNQSRNESSIIINNVSGKVLNYNSSYRIQGTTYFDLPINFKFALQYNSSKGKFDDQIFSNNSLESSLAATIKVSKRLIVNIDNNFYSLRSKHYFFSNLTVHLNPDKGRFSYALKGHNLANVKTYSDISISEFQKYQTDFNIVQRYLLLNVGYRF